MRAFDVSDVVLGLFEMLSCVLAMMALESTCDSCSLQSLSEVVTCPQAHAGRQWWSESHHKQALSSPQLTVHGLQAWLGLHSPPLKS